MRRHILTSSIIAVFFISSSACLAAPPVLEVSPAYMEFTAEQGGANPPGQILLIWRGGGNGPLMWQVTEDCNWVEVTPDSGTSMGEVDVAGVFVDISELAAGIYGCELTVTGDRAANSPQIVDVNLVITGPEIELSATHFDFSAYLVGGSNPADQILGISNGGSGTLNWQITDDCNWLSAEPNSGSSTGEVDDVNLSVDITGLGIGIYDCNLTVSDSNAGNSPQIASVTLSITMVEGIWVEPNSFDVNLIEGTTLTEILTIGNGGTEDVNFIIRSHIVSNPEASAEKLGISSVPEGHDFTVVGDAPYKPGELIVRFAPTANGKVRGTSDKSQILSSLGGGTVKQNFKIVPGLSLVKLPAGMTVEEALQVFNNADGILYAEPDYEVEIFSTFPDDPRFDDLWGMHNTGQTGGTADADIDAPEAWDIGTGSRDIIVAVIDTGVDYTHPDLAANMWVNEAEYSGTPGVDDDNNGYVDDIYGYDFYNYDGDPMDDHYHGTHCAGTVGAVGNNNEGVAGVCWQVKIMALKFLSSRGGGWASDAIMCVDYSVLMGANLSSNSWGGSGYSQGLKDAIDAAGAAGMLFMAAAGNASSNTDTSPHYPSSYDSESIISVMATNKHDTKSSFSNFGPISVDLGAPGSNILSCELGGGYRYASGTSMATPHVAGACALVWSMNPVLSNSEVKDILLQSVDKTLTGLCMSEGRLNIYNAILGTKAPWLEFEPEDGTVGPGDSNDVNVTFSAFEQGLEMTPGTYEAEIIVLSNDACNPTIAVPATMTVTADDLAVIPREGFDANGIEGGPFEPECKTYTLTNNGTLSISWTTLQTVSWLRVEPNAGVLDPNNSIDVNVCITPDANLLDPNIYTELLVFKNTDSNSIKPRPVTLTAKPPDCFTQSMVTNLDFLSLMFSPDGSNAYYEACRERVEAFPIDPNGGTAVSLGDDDYAEVILSNDANILFYGTRYDRFYIGSNGYITFGAGDANASASLVNHFNLPRISALFTDLDPTGGQVSYKQLDDRVVVTFQDVPLSGSPTATNSFQIEMFFVDGSICVNWLEILATSGVAGLSKGRGLPPVFFAESDLGGYLPCCLWGDFSRDYYVNLMDFATLAKHWLDEDCGIPYWCELTDLDFSSIVDGYDLDIFVDNWLAEDEWWLEAVGHWKLDEGDGNTAYDSSRFNHGTIYGAAWTTGKIDGALTFDGNDDYVEIQDGLSMRSIDGNTADHTISLWFNTTQQGAELFSGPTIFDRRATNALSGKVHWVAHIYLNEINAIGFLAGFRSTDKFQLNDAMVINDGIWHHVVVTRKNTEYVKLYVDGNERQSGATTLSPLTTEVTTIGVRRNNSNVYREYFNGEIDDVRIYDRSFSADEIWKLYEEVMMGKKAFNPNPVNKAEGIDPNTVLSWSRGKYAASHDVYFGTDETAVNNATTASPEYQGRQGLNSWDPNSLDLDTDYFWRIDEVNDPNTWKGDVWSFKTWLMPNFVGWWKFDEGLGGIAGDSSGNNNIGTISGATWFNDPTRSWCLDFDGVDDYVHISDSPELSPPKITLAAWIYPDDVSHLFQIIGKWASGDAEYLFDNKSNNDALRLFAAFGGIGDALYSNDAVLTAGTWQHVAVTWDGSTGIFYVDGTFAGQDTSSGDLQDSDNPVTIGRRNDGTRAFDGKIDDVRIYDRALSAGEIWQIYQGNLSQKAVNPNPANGETSADPNVVLSWSPGKDAVSHDVYFGTNYNDVNDATTGSPEYMGNYDVNNYDPCGLDLVTTYYWRIDEVNDPNLWKGNIWSFTTAEVNDPNFVSWWKFDEGSGTTASDSAGDNDGTVYGATWTIGQIDGALDFDGNDYVLIGDSPELNPPKITLAAWIYPDDVSHDFQIIGKWASGDPEYLFDNKNNNDALRLGSSFGAEIFCDLHSNDAVLTAGIWQHVAVTWDGSTAVFYVDGTFAGQDTGCSGDLPDSDNPVTIGLRNDGTRAFDGKIDDVRIYDRALTAPEIWQLYQDGL